MGRAGRRGWRRLSLRYSPDGPKPGYNLFVILFLLHSALFGIAWFGLAHHGLAQAQLSSAWLRMVWSGVTQLILACFGLAQSALASAAQ